MFIQIYHIGVVCRAVQLSERKFSVILIRCPESRRGNKSCSDILLSGLYATLARKEYSVLVDLSVLLRIVSIESDTSQGSCYECSVMLHLNSSYLASLSSYTVISFFAQFGMTTHHINDFFVQFRNPMPDMLTLKRLLSPI